MSATYSYPKANPRHRLAGQALDAALYVVTLGIGWFIWDLIVWGKGQTPGKQILKMRVYDKSTGLPARWGHMLIRQLLIQVTLPIILYPILYLTSQVKFVDYREGYLGFHFDQSVNPPWFGYYGGPNMEILFSLLAFIVYWVILLLPVLDALWIFKGGNKNRLVDIIAKTDVLNEVSRRTHLDGSLGADVNKDSFYSSSAIESRVSREIREAAELFERGQIDEDEYKMLKKRIISKE